MRFFIVLLGLSLVQISADTLAQEKEDPRLVLNKVVCVHYRNVSADPDLSVTFKFEDGDDSADVMVQERVRTRYSRDTLWVEILNVRAQVSGSSTHFGFNGDDEVSMDIWGPIAASSGKKTNATLDLMNGVKVLKLFCETK